MPGGRRVDPGALRQFLLAFKVPDVSLTAVLLNLLYLC